MNMEMGLIGSVITDNWMQWHSCGATQRNYCCAAAFARPEAVEHPLAKDSKDKMAQNLGIVDYIKPTDY